MTPIETPNISAGSVKIELATKDEDAITSVKRQYEERIQPIQQKYQEVMSRVDEKKKELESLNQQLQEAISTGKTWMLDKLNGEIADLQKDIEVQTSIARSYLDKQMKKIEAWMNKQNQRVTDSINDLALKTLDSTNEFLKKQAEKKAEAKIKALQ